MRKIFLWKMLACSLMLTLLLTSCSEFDNPVVGTTPSNSALYSRLKDKNGNPVLLTSTNADGNWGYVYTNDGKLAIFGDLEPDKYGDFAPEEHFVVDGLTFKSGEETNSDGAKWWAEGSLELNQEGLITKAVVVGTGTRANAQLKNKYFLNYTFSYNSDGELLKIDEDVKYERYDEDGNLEKVSTGHGIQTRTWENGNLIKVEFTQDAGDLDMASDSSNKLTTYSYGDELNITRQPLEKQDHLLSDYGINHLYALGLFGVGPKNFPSGMTATLNENGTIHTLNGSLYEYLEP